MSSELTLYITKEFGRFVPMSSRKGGRVSLDICLFLLWASVFGFSRMLLLCRCYKQTLAESIELPALFPEH